ncbi:hypothetical protein KC976_02800 [Candidatus Saccharibacteria bacterium]|jgi:hypothetical protein|nr:hypothetical protein [Candidatus Saccharibacteria bacterium]HPG37527.1 hypothetical protein [Candidatus Saccharibacteria bacterium]
MGSVLVAFILAAGAATFIYSKMGQRIGYSNTQQVWALVAAVFFLVFIAVFVFSKTIGL